MAEYTAYFCGKWVPFSQVKIDPLDRGFLVGDCVFDVARTFNGKSFRSPRTSQTTPSSVMRGSRRRFLSRSGNGSDGPCRPR